MMLRLLSLLLSLFLSNSAFSETTPAVSGSFEVSATSWTNNYGMTQYNKPTPSEACSAWAVGYAGAGATGVATKTTAINYACAGSLGSSHFNATIYPYGSYCPANTTYNGASQKCEGGLMCPDSTWTLNGSTCTRTDQDPCQPKVDLGTKFGIYNFPVGTSITGTYCDGGCRLALGSTAQPYYTDGKTQTKVLSQTYLNGACTASDGVAPQPGTASQTPPDPPKKPPCSDGEGVMTSSTGAVHCVPSGIPGSNKPVVTKEKSVATNPDSSTTTTETTTTRDPTTGVEEKTTVKTDRNASGQVTGTSSETASKGTTTGQDPTKPQNSKFCAENPDLQICKGGMNEEETQKKVLEGVEKVRDSLDSKDFNPESFFEGKDVPEATKQAVEAKMQTAKGEIEAFASGGPGAASFDTFKNLMGDWFEPIGSGGCQAFTVRVGAWTWTHDHCAVAAKISEIGAYCMWVMLAFGIFSMTTKDHR